MIKLTSTLLSSVHAMQGLLKSALLPTNDSGNGNTTAATILSHKVEAKIKVVINKMLEYHCTYWLPNMVRNYAPKQ